MARALGNPILEPSALRCENLARGSGPRAALPAVRFSKIEYYLADNICISMLSEWAGWVQEQSDWAAGLVPNRELRIALPGSARSTSAGG
jgi:hypothetical protein